MTRFDDGYDRGTVVRLFFGHAVGGDEGRPFARKDVVVTATSDDAIVGHEASVSDKSRGSLRGDEDDDPTNDVRVYDRELTVRKASVVMKRDFGSVEDTDVVVRQDPTDTWGVDEEEPELIPDGGEVVEPVRDPDDRVVDEADGEPMPNGIYLIADTPRTAHPLAVEDGSGDRALLREALSEHGVDTVPAPDYPDVRDFVVDRIAELNDDHEHGAPVSYVLEDAAKRFALGTAFDVIRDLHRKDEVYAPTDTTLRRTDTTTDGGDE